MIEDIYCGPEPEIHKAANASWKYPPEVRTAALVSLARLEQRTDLEDKDLAQIALLREVVKETV